MRSVDVADDRQRQRRRPEPLGMERRHIGAGDALDALDRPLGLAAVRMRSAVEHLEERLDSADRGLSSS